MENEGDRQSLYLVSGQQQCRFFQVYFSNVVSLFQFSINKDTKFFLKSISMVSFGCWLFLIACYGELLFVDLSLVGVVLARRLWLQ